MDEYLKNKTDHIREYLENNTNYIIPHYSHFDLHVCLKKSHNYYTINIWWDQCYKTHKLLEDKKFASIEEAIQTLYDLTDKDGNFLYFSKFHTKIFLNQEEKNMYENNSNIKLIFYLNKKEIPTCCVCLEETILKTICNHPLCLDCHSKIINICPYCRQIMDIEYEDMPELIPDV